MKLLTFMHMENYFEDANGIGVIGCGETIDVCFSQIALNMFALMYDVTQVHLKQIITFEFTEKNNDQALKIWLTLLLEKSREHNLMFGDFRIKHENNIWRATVSGEKMRIEIKRQAIIKRVAPAKIKIKKIDHHWEARCIVEV